MSAQHSHKDKKKKMKSDITNRKIRKKHVSNQKVFNIKINAWL